MSRNRFCNFKIDDGSWNLIDTLNFQNLLGKNFLHTLSNRKVNVDFFDTVFFYINLRQSKTNRFKNIFTDTKNCTGLFSNRNKVFRRNKMTAFILQTNKSLRANQLLFRSRPDRLIKNIKAVFCKTVSQTMLNINCTATIFQINFICKNN